VGLLDRIRRPNAQQMGIDQDVQGLARALAHRNPEVRREVVTALSTVNDPAKAELVVDLLVHAVNDEDEDVRAAALVALKWCPWPAINAVVARRHLTL